MIPSDVASRLQVSADTTLRPAAPAQEITEKLSGLVAGQRVMAEIQAMLPNGTYRAMINQRNITLALPFAAKSGDSLELLVTESDGKLALAILSGKEGENAKAPPTTTSTLSRAAQLISELFSSTRQADTGKSAVPLNDNQPISKAPPQGAQDLLPLLRQAITQSGMFYESHQAEWLEGRYTKADLLQEPQGKISTAVTAEEMRSAMQSRVSEAALPERAVQKNSAELLQPGTDTRSDASRTEMASRVSSPLIAPQTHALVQQQLEALATQNFAWQGQIWPGQEMHWEIDEDAGRQNENEADSGKKWTTRLNLKLPALGDIDAEIRLHGNQIKLLLTAPQAETRSLIDDQIPELRQQLDKAGLFLESLSVLAATEGPPDARQEES